VLRNSCEWKRRGWTKQQKQFVMTPYVQRGITLAHDASSDREMDCWHAWRAAEGWKTETFPEYLDRVEKERS